MADERPWLLLDLAGVLLDFAPERRLERIAALSGLPPNTVATRVKEDGISDRLDVGQSDEAELAKFLSGLAERPVEIEQAWRVWLSAFSVAPPMAELRDLGKRFRIGIFTNNHRAITRLFDSAPFEKMFFSSELGVRKPDPRSYVSVGQALGTNAVPIFVDDGEANVQGARRAGWRAIRYGPSSGSLLSALY